MPTKERREKRLAQGLCGACGKEPHLPNSTTCQTCLDYRKGWRQGETKERQPRSSNGRDKEKQRQRQSESYHSNKEKYRQRQRDNRNRARLHILQKKLESGGCPCGEKHPALLDFHHRNPNEKEITATEMIRNKWLKERIDVELEKCDVLCANCHRRLHWELENPDDLDGFQRLVVAPKTRET
jgi:hypothetical protein